MHYFVPKLFVIALVLVGLISPPLAFAQTATTTATSTPSIQDGSSDWGSSRWQRIRGYRQQSSELQQKISALGTAAISAVSIPILFGVSLKNIYPNFGDPRDGGARTHEGEDIMGVKGTPIISPTAAVVLRTGTGSSEGNYVYTANPGGETFVYMHLDRIGEGVSPGTVLTQGGLIGYVGNTGNASGGAAHLHFEIHNSSGAIDPFPRLTVELTPAQKINNLTTILAQTANPTALAEFLVTNFRSVFLDALAQNISVPPVIVTAMATIPASTAGARTTTTTTLPAGDLELGSAGTLVVALQTYLIQAASGAAATRLTQAGATGTFGPLTQAALVEYQTKVGISPASGYYGNETRTYVGSHPLVAGQTPAASVALTRDLKQGMTGQDVLALQKKLNASGYVVATSGSGSPGNETTYFGAATQAAVIKFQIARNITPAVGYVGPITRAALAAIV